MSRLLSARAKPAQELERQIEIDATIAIIHASLMDLDDYLAQTSPDQLDPLRAARSAEDLHSAIILAIEVSGKYAVKSAARRDR